MPEFKLPNGDTVTTDNDGKTAYYRRRGFEEVVAETPAKKAPAAKKTATEKA